ncbi:TetR family transcriptional regulator, partial [Rhodococcus corynebacterioides]|nr:TetR family transcriptional regulator [Rhodococcus corynebacterioides]
MGSVTTEPGLRDRKKAETRSALSAAAVSLGRELGYDGVTAEAIAAHAGVSTRTFHNYFSSKEEAALFHLQKAAFEWVDLLENRPADENFWDSVRYLLLEVVTAPERELAETIETARFIEETPSLLAKKLAFDKSLSDEFRRVVAERTGLDARRDLFPTLAQASVGAAVSAALAYVAEDPEHRSARAVVEHALQQLEQGLNTPLPGPTPP